jgi:hypothetical protein
MTATASVSEAWSERSGDGVVVRKWRAGINIGSHRWSKADGRKGKWVRSSC